MNKITCIIVAFTVFFLSTKAEARPHHKHRHHHITHASDGNIIGGRPPGCPHAFCGCGASLYLFGKIIEPLNRAAEWISRFPRTFPAPGMAAARRHHVMVLVEHRHGDVWLVHDSNFGHRTLVHERSISGYVIVNPQSNRSVHNDYFADARSHQTRSQRMVSRASESSQSPMLRWF